MKTVYLLKSSSHPGKRYTGITSDLTSRLEAHNRGASGYTKRYVPWKVAVSISFESDEKAEDFESYLKSGAGHAWARRHHW
ncbi:MAG: GIY-YIG nuclease family protein [Planctomycetota bacterium]